MTRIKTGPTRQKRHKKILKLSKGYRMTKGRLYKVSKEAVLHAGQYAYIGRKLRKRDFRRLWIQRINASLKDLGEKYNSFINLLKKKHVDLNRKMLAEIAVRDKNTFKDIVKTLKES